MQVISVAQPCSQGP